MQGPTPPATLPAPLTQLSDEERLLRQSVREFAERAVRPLVREMEDQAAIPRTLVDDLFALGVMGVTAADTHGGMGGSCFDAVIVVEELARVDAAVALMVDVQNTLIHNALRRWASPELQAQAVRGLTERVVGAYALSEADAGSDAFALQTRAVPIGDSYQLDGRKMWITNAAEAGLFLVFATVDPDAGYRGVTAFLVDRDTPGLSIGHKEDKLGIRASSTCEVLFDHCVVPASRVVGEVGRGYRVAIDTLNEGRIGIGAQMVGVASAALTYARDHVRTRRQFGKAVADFQGVQFQFARAATEVEAARLLVYNAARLCDAGLPFLTEAAMCKLYASEVAERTASLAVNLFGGAGYVKDAPVEKLYRDAKIGQIYEGTSNMQLQTIARELLKPS